MGERTNVHRFFLLFLLFLVVVSFVDDVYHRRLFMYDQVSGVSANGQPPEMIRYVDYIEIECVPFRVLSFLFFPDFLFPLSLSLSLSTQNHDCRKQS